MQAFLVSDSVAMMRFATGVGDDASFVAAIAHKVIASCDMNFKLPQLSRLLHTVPIVVYSN